MKIIEYKKWVIKTINWFKNLFSKPKSSKSKFIIIYRCCENEVTGNFRPSRPKFFNKIKSLDSLINSVDEYKQSYGQNIDVEIHIVHDGDRGLLYNRLIELKHRFKKIHLVKFKNNKKSYLHCVQLATKLDWQYLYMVEDDYLHTKHAISTLIEGVQKLGCVTGYFHTDRITRSDDISRGKEFIYATRSTHWVTNESTTCTYMINFKLKELILDAAQKFDIRDREMWRFLFEQAVRLWVPTPGVSTHLENGLMTPFIDWEAVTK